MTPLLLCSVLQSENDTPEDIQLAFRQFDRANENLITFDDLKEVVQDLGEELTNEEIMEMITYFKVQQTRMPHLFDPRSISDKS